MTGSSEGKDSRRPHSAWAPLSEGQAGLWALQKGAPGAAAYNLPVCFRTGGDLNREAFVNACRATLRRHPVLASRVTTFEGRPFLCPGPEPDFKDLEENAEHLTEAALAQRLREFVRRPFDLEHGPLLRVRLYRRGDGHVLVLFVIHHIIFDGASVIPFIESLAANYRSTAEAALDIAQQVVELGEFPKWEQEMLNSPEGEEHLRYWKEVLSGELPVLKLPLDFPKPAERSFDGRTITHQLGDALAGALNTLAKENYLNPSSVFLSLFKTLLQRYTGQHDIIVGIPVMNRWRHELADRIGYFINLIALRTRVRDEQGFDELAQAVQLNLLDALDHAEYPFTALVRKLGARRDSYQSPIFQVGYYYQNYLRPAELDSFKEEAAGELEVRFTDLVHQEGEYDLALEVYRHGAGFVLNLKYDPTLFTGRRAELMMRHLVRLAEEVVRNPRRPLKDYELITDAERGRLLEWNDTRRPFPATYSTHRLIAEQASRHPDKVALSCGARSLTYRELERRSNALAAHLRSLGVAGGSRVALCLDRSPEMVVAMLGVMKAGAAYVPLDPEYPTERLAYMLADAEASAVIAQASTRHRLTLPPAFPPVLIDQDWGRIAAAYGDEAVAPAPPADADDLAYVIYTSGSTGKPKGVMISHRALCNFLHSMAAEPGFTSSDRLLAVTTYGFDIAALELFLPLVQGGEFVICDGEKVKTPELLRAEIARVAPTVMQATPATWTMLFRSGWSNDRRIKILCGGEALPEQLRDELLRSGAEVWNMFGPTETTVWSTISRVRLDAPITIGRPIANTQVYVLDGHLNLTPVGVAGELCIAGEGVARGYWKQPELTSRKFVENPFQPGTRLYRTGDLARWRDDGELEFLGRLDDQVKLRGFRIEVGEIESALVRHPSVSSCVVVLKDAGDLKQLVAYYTRDASFAGREPGAEQSAREFREFLRETLPEYMLPAVFVELGELPLTPNGKLDRKALAARPVEPAPRPALAEAQTEVETRILGIWRQMLKNDRIGVEDTFFEVGGDSISAVSVADRIGRELRREITTTSLFKYPDVRRLSAFVSALPERGLENAVAGAGVVPVAPAPEPARASVLPDYYDDCVAIIGLSCRFPESRDHREFWANLCAGKELLKVLSREELHAAGVSDELIGDPRFVPVQSHIYGKELFDAEFFGILPRDAEYMDPQLRLLLLHSWHAFEDAGYVAEKVPLTGVFMSASNSFYHALLPNIAPRAGKVLAKPSEYVSWVLAQGGSIPTMISYKLGLTGPSFFVHSNCSSSLVGLHVARQSLLSRECDYALVGGAALSPSTHYGYLHQAGLNFSADGHVKAFDETADGMVGGEGVAVVLLKRAAEAVRDGDNIYALLRATAVNNDGSDKVGFYAPSVQGQAGVIEQAMRSAGVGADSICYVEAHGTGTRLGDPIEIQALSEVYSRETGKRQFCGIGSVKTNLGHLDAAAGLAGCIKVALSLKNGAVPPSINYSRPSREIDFGNTPFYVLDRMKRWPVREEPARAALSSFGLGGTNTHAILERFTRRPVSGPASSEAASYIVPLSAKTPERLAAYVNDLLRFLVGEPAGEQSAIADIAYTLQAGRKAMSARVAFVVESRQDLVARLRDYTDASPARRAVEPQQPETERIGAAVRGANDPQELLRAWCRDRNHDAVARAWAAGMEIDWLELYSTGRPYRISLPGYPFAEERFWAAEVFGPVGEDAGSVARLHPLVHRNTSDLSGQKFSTDFSGREFFLADHVVFGRRTLPAVAYLEMARAAAALALGDPAAANKRLVIKNVMWSRPLVVGGRDAAVGVNIALSPDVRGELSYRVYTTQDDDASPVIHSLGTIEVAEAEAAPTRDLRKLTESCREVVLDAAQCYQAFDDAGIVYGPAHRGLVEVATGYVENEGLTALARLALPPGLRAEADAYLLHPSLLDSAVQASLVLRARRDGDDLTLPYSVKAVRTYERCPPAVLAVVQQGGDDEANRRVSSFDIDLCDEHGKVCVRLEGIVSRSVKGSKATADDSAARHDTLLFAPRWAESPAPAVSPMPEESRLAVVLCEFDVPGLSRVDFGAANVLSLRSDAPTPARRFVDYALRLKELLTESMADHTRPTFVQVICASRGDGSLLAGLAGLLKSARQESTRLSAQLIEFHDPVPASELRARLDENRASPQDAHVRYAGGKRMVTRWAECDGLRHTTRWRDDGVYLITGGAGELGLKMAGEIIRKSVAARVVLAGRSALQGRRAERVRELEAGGRVEYLQADISERAQVAKLMDALRETYGVLHGVIHAAGIMRDGLLLRKTDEEFRRVLEPKVEGAFYLDELSQAFPLDFFILFSSVSGAFGSAGQSDYAAANAFCDAFAHWRQALVESGRRQGLTISIDWPLWEVGGMKMSPRLEEALAREKGLVALPDAEALATLYRAAGANSPQVLVLHGDGAKIRQALREDAPATPPPREGAPTWARQAAPAADEALSQKVLDYLKSTVAEVTHLPVERIDAAATFDTLGVDSIMVIELATALEKQFGSLPKVLFFEYQNLSELADYFVTSHGKEARALFGSARPDPVAHALHVDAAGPGARQPAATTGQPEAPSAPTAARATTELTTSARHRSNSMRLNDRSAEIGDIAIIGVAGRYPKARDLEEFWENLSQGRDCIIEIPAERWDHSLYFDEDKNRPGKTYSKWGGFLDDVDKFDAKFFNISPREAEYMDPQERLFLECVYECLEDAGYTRKNVATGSEGGLAGNVGVFAGMMYEEYQLYGAQETLQGRPVALSGSPASIANRVSYFCNFHGPSVAVDTMCSSSLTAIHLACLSLREGDCEAAIAGGVNVSIHPNKYLMLGQGKFVSSKGRCESFGIGGDGYVPGEGVGAVLLKPLDRALESGDQIYAIIKSTAVNHGGKVSGYSVPNPNAQAAVIRRAVERAGIHPATLSYVEAHGTGTVLGDPIEIVGLSKCFAEYTTKKQFCALGSAKSNIGHAESAAGVAGLTKVLLQMRHKQLAPSLHSEVLNPHIDFANSPFVVQQTLSAWERPVVELDGVEREYPRRAGISSFGAGGSNAHIIVEEYVPTQAPAPEPVDGPGILVLSAKSEPQLKSAAERLLRAVSNGRYEERQLRDICYTSQVGREAMDYRLALPATSLKQLEDTLAGFVEGRKNLPDLYSGHVKETREAFSIFGDDEDMMQTIKAWLSKEKYAKVCHYWAKGGTVDWDKLYDGERPRRISLPTYPFKRERFWVPVVEQPPPAAAVPQAQLPPPAPRRPSGPQPDVSHYEQLLDDLLSERTTVDEAARLVVTDVRRGNGRAGAQSPKK
ncbi:MAG TPA: amino acid adenylation domain-containing protein [Pyrinomonadaceae bacterium]